MRKTVSIGFTFVLVLLAGVIAVLIFTRKSPWSVIGLYWVVVTGKNVCDYLALRKEQTKHDFSSY